MYKFPSPHDALGLAEETAGPIQQGTAAALSVLSQTFQMPGRWEFQCGVIHTQLVNKAPKGLVENTPTARALRINFGVPAGTVSSPLMDAHE